jgi:RNA polymerase sigma-70 factor, ECF subfamily
MGGSYDKAFYDRTAQHVWAVLGRAGVQRTDERHEVMQDVYLVAHRRWAARDPKIPEKAWIGAIARRVGTRHRDLGRTRSEQPMEQPDTVEVVSDDLDTRDEPALGSAAPISGLDPEHVARRRDQYVQLVAGLSDERREVFEMHELDGWPTVEIAATVGVPEGTVKTRLRAARKHVEGAAARMAAQEAHAERRGATLPLLLPFGTGAWRPIAQLFEDAPPDMAEKVWRGLQRQLVRYAVVAAAAGEAGRAAAGALFGGGMLAGGGVVAGALYALHLLATPPAPPPPIAREPDAVAVALAPTGIPAENASASHAAAPEAVTVASAGAPQQAPAERVDPQEERLLQRVQALYDAHDYEGARAALREHAHAFPPGRAKLRPAMERWRVKVDAATAAPDGGADAGRHPHRLLGSDDEK